MTLQSPKGQLKDFHLTFTVTHKSVSSDEIGSSCPIPPLPIYRPAKSAEGENEAD